MIIRNAEPRDVGALSRIAESSYRAAFASILDEDVLLSRNADYFARRFRESWPSLTVASDEGWILGFCLLTDGHVDMLFLAPEATGRGVGALLLKHAEKNGAKSLECFRDNRRARAFYEREGWTLARSYERDFAGKPHAFVFYEKPR
ncbi:GNAT family N-acetyltransferase [Microvirga pudoricolor]|uniref:GNAT family N-acetyltransferase n=1 Tax=Microvirga pudoricolor TaxID=2778729 RepID=UPI00194FF33A|nr:GNAT family N-acetyltransferase [Microvirga pudoricolor]MBM6593326.1 GNAT family N-acetyltransferase [Microvirga pudoricolor]